MRSQHLIRSAVLVCLTLPAPLAAGARPESAPSSTRLDAPGAPTRIDYYGKSVDVFRLFGQRSIPETSRNLVTANGI